MWRVLQSAKILQSATEPCRNAILAGGRTIPIARSWDDLENKPFGTKTDMVEIVPEQSVKTDGDYGVQYCTYIPSTPLNNAESVTVMLNGTKYECPVWIDEKWGVMIAGGGWINESTPDFSEYPFTIELQSNEVAMHWTKDLGETITIAIYAEQEIVIPIDPKFSGVMVVKITPEYNDDGLTGVNLDKPIKEICDAKNNGNIVLGIDDQGYTYTFEGYYEEYAGEIYPQWTFISHQLRFVNEEVGNIEIRRKVIMYTTQTEVPYYAIFNNDMAYENCDRQVAYINSTDEPI